MKIIIKRMLQLATLAVLGFGGWKGYEVYRENKISRSMAKKSSIQAEKPFVVIVTASNVENNCEKNLLSILCQSYENFRILFIDDASTDSTLAKVTHLKQSPSFNDKITLISHREKKGALGSLYEAIHTLKDEEIVVVIDGNDFLSHELVLSKLNKIYSSSATWLTYGNYLNYPSYKQKPSVCKPIAKRVVFNNSYRKQELSSFHPKTFYAGLFKLIRKEDLCFKGSFFPLKTDLAMMLPMLEMSGKHTRFVSDVMYLYNKKKEPFSKELLELEHECTKYAYSLPKYKRLSGAAFAPPPLSKN